MFALGEGSSIIRGGGSGASTLVHIGGDEPTPSGKGTGEAAHLQWKQACLTAERAAGLTPPVAV